MPLNKETKPNQSPCPANLQHSFIMWVIVSLLPPRNQYLQFCCILSILVLTDTACGCFTLALADGLLLEFGWQQIPSCLQDSSQYSGRSQQYCNLDGYDKFSDFQNFQTFFQAVMDRSKSVNYNSYRPCSRVLQLSFFSVKV